MDLTAAMRTARAIDDMADAFHPSELSGQSFHPGNVLDVIEAALLWGAGRVSRDDFVSAVEDLNLDHAPVIDQPRGGAPVVVLPTAELVDRFVDELLAGGVVELGVDDGRDQLVVVTGTGREQVGHVTIVGHRYDEDTATEDVTDTVTVGWESIVRIALA